MQLLERLLENGTLKPKGVLGLGAEFAQEAPLYAKAGAEFVLWIEASAENLPLARAELAKHTNQVLLHNAVWDKDDEELTFNIYNARSSNSLFTNDKMQMWYPRHHVERSEKVKSITVDTALERSWLPKAPPDLLVMDLQGAELRALEGAKKLLAGKGLAHIVTEAVTEPLYRGGCLLSDLDSFLGSYGFHQVELMRHEVSIWYDEIGAAIARGELAPIPQFDVLYVR